MPTSSKRSAATSSPTSVTSSRPRSAGSCCWPRRSETLGTTQRRSPGSPNGCARRPADWTSSSATSSSCPGCSPRTGSQTPTRSTWATSSARPSMTCGPPLRSARSTSWSCADLRTAGSGVTPGLFVNSCAQPRRQRRGLLAVSGTRVADARAGGLRRLSGDHRHRSGSPAYRKVNSAGSSSGSTGSTPRARDRDRWHRPGPVHRQTRLCQPRRRCQRVERGRPWIDLHHSACRHRPTVLSDQSTTGVLARGTEADLARACWPSGCLRRPPGSTAAGSPRRAVLLRPRPG
jgi:hypothetical protein